MSQSEGEALGYYAGAKRAWQLAAAALSFAVFGLVGWFFALCVAPALRIFLAPARQRRTARRIIGGWCRVFIRMMRALGLVSYETSALERLHAPGQVIIANHPTLIDGLFLVGFAAQVDCVVKGALLRNPFLRSAVRAAGYLTNDASEAFIEAGVRRLQAGHSVVVFPEGTRSPRGETRRFLRGFAHLALQARAPVLPVVIRCTPPGLVKGEPWYRLPPRPMHFEFRVLEPLRPSGFDGVSARALAARRLRRYVQTLYA